MREGLRKREREREKTNRQRERGKEQERERDKVQRAIGKVPYQSTERTRKDGR